MDGLQRQLWVRFPGWRGPNAPAAAYHGGFFRRQVIWGELEFALQRAERRQQSLHARQQQHVWGDALRQPTRAGIPTEVSLSFLSAGLRRLGRARAQRPSATEAAARFGVLSVIALFTTVVGFED